MPNVERYSFFERARTMPHLPCSELSSLKSIECRLHSVVPDPKVDMLILQFLRNTRQSSTAEQLRITEERIAQLDVEIRADDELAYKREKWMRYRLDAQRQAYRNTLGMYALINQEK